MPIQVMAIQDQVMLRDLARQPIKLSLLGWGLGAELLPLRGEVYKSETMLGVY